MSIREDAKIERYCRENGLEQGIHSADRQTIIELRRKVKELQQEIDRQEGRRLFELCVRFGAKPGSTYKWLKEQLYRGQYD